MNNAIESIEGMDDVNFDDLELSEFDSAEFLNTEESIAGYLSSAMQSGDQEHIKAALKTVGRARNMAGLAAAAGITREGAYKALRKGTKPQMQTIMGILDALDMAIQVVPKRTLVHG